MTRYYFDLLDEGDVAVDEDGTDLPNFAAAQAVAARVLSDIARDAAREIGSDRSRLLLAIEVRDDRGPLLQVKYTFEISRLD
jgi:hypothetical protein